MLKLNVRQQSYRDDDWLESRWKLIEFVLLEQIDGHHPFVLAPYVDVLLLLEEGADKILHLRTGQHHYRRTRRDGSGKHTLRFKASSVRFWSNSITPVFLVVCLLEPTPQFTWQLAPTDVTKIRVTKGGRSAASLSITVTPEEFSDGTILRGIAEAVPAAQANKLLEKAPSSETLPRVVQEAIDQTNGIVVSLSRGIDGDRVQWVTKDSRSLYAASPPTDERRLATRMASGHSNTAWLVLYL